MRNILFALVLLTVMYGCGGSASENNTTDSTGLTNPTAIDTSKHPSGVDNSSVISTDTAAMNVQNSYKKADSARKKK